MLPSLFEYPASKRSYAVAVFIYAGIWYAAILSIALSFSENPWNSEKIETAPAFGVFVVGALVAPLVENYIFTAAIRFFADGSPRKVAITGAMVAAAIHASTKSIFAFGLFYIVAAVFLTNFRKNPRFAFWLGVLVHAVCNLPAAVAPLLLAAGLIGTS